MTEWQPIETAPRDGTAILVIGTFAGEINGPFDQTMFGVVQYTGDGDYVGFPWALQISDGYSVWAAPTHWMPLPTPPSEGTPND